MAYIIVPKMASYHSKIWITRQHFKKWHGKTLWFNPCRLICPKLIPVVSSLYFIPYFKCTRHNNFIFLLKIQKDSKATACSPMQLGCLFILYQSCMKQKENSDDVMYINLFQQKKIQYPK
jgi:hypothetical protein